VPSLLVTNDFPPKHGGIQSYLYELWRRLPPGDTTVLTTAFPDAASWDARQDFRIERVRQRVLLPTPAVARRIDALAREIRADVIFLDPMLPIGLVGPRLTAAPYVVVAHGSEITGYARTPGSGTLARPPTPRGARSPASLSRPVSMASASIRSTRRRVPRRANASASTLIVWSCSVCRDWCRARASTS
jgi:hypothetical protein